MKPSLEAEAARMRQENWEHPGSGGWQKRQPAGKLPRLCRIKIREELSAKLRRGIRRAIYLQETGRNDILVQK